MFSEVKLKSMTDDLLEKEIFRLNQMLHRAIIKFSPSDVFLIIQDDLNQLIDERSNRKLGQ